jgi:hypothetical protein
MTRPAAITILLATLALFALASGACLAATLTVTSPSFKDGDRAPKGMGCEGGEHSPALTVSGVPAGAKSVAVLVTEIESPKSGAPLWMAYNIPPQPSITIAENQPRARQMKGEGVQLPGPAGKLGYSGPCPPQGVTRRYMIEVFALDSTLELPDNASKRDFLLAVEGRILAKGKLTFRYKK